MEFDNIEDNMISTKNGGKYVMVVECQGINYDLMSELEKNAVEEGFVQFLNTLRHPIQIYTQTRTINLESSIQTYKSKIEELGKINYEFPLYQKSFVLIRLHSMELQYSIFGLIHFCSNSFFRCYR